ncbi:MAG TPA: hypothetical protein VK904_03800 [Miltoncostaeaceae bacterium]|nr:hypothetical protein [Miltoncostaeaceae bacterium]
MTAPRDWPGLVEGLRPHVSPDWVRHAEEHGGQSWIRLILLVDAHHQLSSPRVTEKVAMTMADLAVGHEREAERQGWEEVRQTAQEQRMALVAGLVDAAPALLPEDLQPLFARSIEPSPPGM